jgi:hypothetical protein
MIYKFIFIRTFKETVMLSDLFQIKIDTLYYI